MVRPPTIRNVPSRDNTSFTGRFTTFAAATQSGRIAPADFAAETAAEKGRDYPNIFHFEIEDIGQRMGGQVNGLRGIVHRHAAVLVPNGDGGMRLNRVVVVARRAVNMVDTRFRLRESLVRVADLDFRRFAHDVVGHHSLGFRAFERNIRRLGVVLHRDQRRGMLRSLQRFGDDYGHGLAVPMHIGVLHDRKIAQRKALADIVEIHNRRRFHPGYILRA